MCLEIEYEGQAEAKFQDPNIKICGPVRIIFDESGKSSIEMEVKKSNKVGLAMHHVSRILDGNKCIRLIVDTKDGIFSADEEILFTDREGYNARQEMRYWLKFHPLSSVFDATNAEPPKYWRLPLLNFVSNFSCKCSDLSNHPLRIDNEDYLIPFKFNDAWGFIEPLIDYKERVKKLCECNIQNTLTAIMVGEVGSCSIEYNNLKKWFPFDFLGLLGLSTGSEVSAQCIEFRDARGGLVKRMHLGFKTPCYSKGHVAIDEFYNIGIGQLLNSFQNYTSLQRVL